MYPRGAGVFPVASKATLCQGTGLPAWWAAPHTVCKKTSLFIVLKPWLASHIPSVTKPCSHLPPKRVSSLFHSLSAHSHPPVPDLGLSM